MSIVATEKKLRLMKDNQEEYSHGFKKIVKFLIILLATFVVVTKLGEVATIVYGLLLLAGLMLFVVLLIVTKVGQALANIIYIIKDFLNTRYIVVFRF